jgi:myosin heavy subunit
MHIHFISPVYSTSQTRHNVDKVLVGGEGVQNSIDRKDLVEFLSSREKTDTRPGKQTSCFFYTHKGSSWKYTTQVSRYTGEIGIDTMQVGRANMIQPGTDPAIKEQLASVIRTAEETIERIQPEIDSYNVESQKLHTQGQQATEKLKSAKRAKQDWQQHKSKLANQKDKLAEAEENANKDNNKEKKKSKAKIQKMIDNSITMADNAAKAHNEMMKTMSSLTGLKMSEDGLQDSLRKLA